MQEPRCTRLTCAKVIGLYICKAHVFDEAFGVNNAFNAEVFLAPPHAVAIEFASSGRRGVVIGSGRRVQQKTLLVARAVENRTNGRTPFLGLVQFTNCSRERIHVSLDRRMIVFGSL
jgi:hypothetical protein